MSCSATIQDLRGEPLRAGRPANLTPGFWRPRGGPGFNFINREPFEVVKSSLTPQGNDEIIQGNCDIVAKDGGAGVGGWGWGVASKLGQDDKSVIMSMFVERARGRERDNEKVVKERRGEPDRGALQLEMRDGFVCAHLIICGKSERTCGQHCSWTRNRLATMRGSYLHRPFGDTIPTLLTVVCRPTLRKHISNVHPRRHFSITN